MKVTSLTKKIVNWTVCEGKNTHIFLLLEYRLREPRLGTVVCSVMYIHVHYAIQVLGLGGAAALICKDLSIAPLECVVRRQGKEDFWSVGVLRLDGMYVAIICMFLHPDDQFLDFQI